MKGFQNPFEEHIYTRYLHNRNEQILRSARLKLIFGFIILSCFALIDILLKHNIISFYSRLVPLAVITYFFILDFFYFRKGKIDSVFLMYNVLLLSLLFMIYISFISEMFFIDTDKPLNAAGIVLVTAVVGIEIRGSLSTIMTILVMQFLIFSLLLLLYDTHIKTDTIILFAHVLSINLLMILISYYLENQNFNAYKANIKLEIEKNKTQSLYTNLIEQKEEILSQNEEITQQRDLAEEQNKTLENQKKEITDSLTYAQRIQNSLLPKEQFFKDNFSDYFILFRPKAIVSGDFYWSTLLDNWLVFAVVDSTGHGVPAGFMSMLGFSFLNEIVNNNKIIEADVILNTLRKNVIDALDQKNVIGSSKDGMDIGICVLNTQTKELHFSGANFNLMVVNNSDDVQKTQEIKGDKMPISIYFKMNPFTAHKIDIETGDTLYLYSDGYHDQFGGPRGKKIKSRPFKELLKRTSGKNMNFQYKLLQDYLHSWMNYEEDGHKKRYEQNDDITILGLRF
ncbi:MAG: SpoIIE family protein phosphatase [Bacteroidales bacterium]|nr:SpoIIE family protein phosphatase [Bacteroidales bacterium]